MGGMEGETRENVREIMGFPAKDNPKLFRDAFKLLTANASDPEKNPKYSANMITVNTENKIRNSYASDIKKCSMETHIMKNSVITQTKPEEISMLGFQKEQIRKLK